MPFKSESQRRFLWAKKPKLARKWSDKYGSPKNLPKHVRQQKQSRRRLSLRSR